LATWATVASRDGVAPSPASSRSWASSPSCNRR
jgi:hypothetical protein